MSEFTHFVVLVLKSVLIDFIALIAHAWESFFFL